MVDVSIVVIKRPKQLGLVLLFSALLLQMFNLGYAQEPSEGTVNVFTTYYYLEIIVTNGGNTTPVPSTYQYAPDTNVTVEATADSDYQFEYWMLQWTGDSEVRTENPTVVAMDRNYTLVAHFQVEPRFNIVALALVWGVGGGFVATFSYYYVIVRNKGGEEEEFVSESPL